VHFKRWAQVRLQIFHSSLANYFKWAKRVLFLRIPSCNCNIVPKWIREKNCRDKRWPVTFASNPQHSDMLGFSEAAGGYFPPRQMQGSSPIYVTSYGARGRLSRNLSSSLPATPTSHTLSRLCAIRDDIAGSF